MTHTPTTSITFLWHLHQPDYRRPDAPSSLLPWVRLHATKAYFDLPWLLAQYPKVRACVNFSGVLVEQLQAYVHHGRRDLWWELTLKKPSEMSEDERWFVLKNFFSAHWERLIDPIDGYRALLDKRGREGWYRSTDAFSDQEILDLQVYFNLVWMGFAARAEYPLVQELLTKGGGYTHDEKERLCALQLQIMGRVLGMYRDLVESGQIEVTMTPMNHPILPLLIDTDAAQRATPHRPLPEHRHAYPEDALWHVTSALELGRETFGESLCGMWPAEGSVSPEAVDLFAQAGVRWIATDEDVLLASSPVPPGRENALYRPYWVQGPNKTPIAAIFRDHIISDLIGFTYAKVQAHDAARDLLDHVRRSAQHAANTSPRPLVPIILDGENPWEAYPDDGQAFLRALYEGLSQDSTLETVRVCDWLDAHPPTHTLDHLHSGSWILGNYQIWIGAQETNRAWTQLALTRDWFEEQHKGGSLDPDAIARAQKAMHAAQGSDWFWWYGDDFECAHADAFDALFRSNLRAVYEACGANPPDALHTPILNTPTPVLIQAPTQRISPQIDGRDTHFYEWAGAGRFEPRGGAGAMMKVRTMVESIHFGFDRENVYVRVAPGKDLQSEDAAVCTVRLVWLSGDAKVFDVALDGNEPRALWDGQGLGASDQTVELSVPWAVLGTHEEGEECAFQVTVLRSGIEIERQPPTQPVRFRFPGEDFEARHWVV